MKVMYNRDPLKYYQVLEVSPDADPRTIKLSYRDCAKKWHPDYNKSEDAMEHFQKISVAYDILQDEDKRLTYDLLACAYESDDFPQMDALSIFKDRTEAENPNVRVVDLQYVVGKLIRCDKREERLICSEKQAFNEIVKCSLSNWLVGWWGLEAFVANCRALKANFCKTGNSRQDNLTLLLHNALAYHQEKKDAQAAYSAIQAMDYALPEQRKLLERYIAKLNCQVPRPVCWRWRRLKTAHLLVPFVLVMLFLSFGVNSTFGSFRQYMNKQHEVTYFQKVTFNDGNETFDDVVVSKIFDVPVNVYDETMLYHLRDDSKVMYGPDDKFDVMTNVKKGQTVRVTGFTLNKKWYRIMLDNGEMGFIKKSMLDKGYGLPVPAESKILLIR